MSKWKCEICGAEFENFHAQGFDNKIYCPLCYFKKENQELKKQLEKKYEKAGTLTGELLYEENTKLINQQKEFIEYLENEIKNSDICDVYVRGMKFNSAEKMIYKDILSKYKEIIRGRNGN